MALEKIDITSLLKAFDNFKNLEKTLTQNRKKQALFKLLNIVMNCLGKR